MADLDSIEPIKPVDFKIRRGDLDGEDAVSPQVRDVQRIIRIRDHESILRSGDNLVLVGVLDRRDSDFQLGNGSSEVQRTDLLLYYQ